MRNISSNEMEKKKSLQIKSPEESERTIESKKILVTDTMEAYLNQEKELSGELDDGTPIKTPITNHQGLTHLEEQKLGLDTTIINFDNPKLTPFLIENHSDLSSEPGDALKDIDEQMRGTYGGNNAFN